MSKVITAKEKNSIRALLSSGLQENFKLACQILFGKDFTPREVVPIVAGSYLDTVNWAEKESIDRDSKNESQNEGNISCWPEHSSPYFITQFVTGDKVFVGKSKEDLRPFITWIVSFCGEHSRTSQTPSKKILFFDTETNRLPKSYPDFRQRNAKRSWCHMVQLGWQLTDDLGNLLDEGSYIIKPDNFEISLGSVKIHGITHKKAKKEGVKLTTALRHFLGLANKADLLVAHNVDFDFNVVGIELLRSGIDHQTWVSKPRVCTMRNGTEYCALYDEYWGHRWPELSVLHHRMFGETFKNAHDAFADTIACRRVYFGLLDNCVEMHETVAEPDEVFKPKSPKQLPDGVAEHSLEGIQWVCLNSASKKRLQGVMDNLNKYGLTIQDLDYDVRVSFASNCNKKGFDFLPRDYFAHDGTHIGRKISSYESEELTRIWLTWGGARDSWDNLLKDYPRYMRNSMYKYFEKVERNVKSRRSQIRKVLKQRKGYEDFVI